MKKVVTLFVMLTLCCLFLVGCGQKTKVLKETDQFIIVTPSDDFVGKTLEKCMEDLKSRGELDYKIANNMITSINGIDNAVDYSFCWMLYTDDISNANNAWGTIEYKEKVYCSAVLGAESLVVAKGCIYIWVYTQLSF